MILTILKSKKIIFLELLMGLLLLAYMAYFSTNVSDMEINISDFQTQYCIFNDNTWSIKNINNNIDNPITLISSPHISLKKGSYTIRIIYNTNIQQQFTIESDTNSTFLHANPFNLSKNKNTIEYDFYLTQNIDDITLSLTNYTQGDFSLSGITIYKNANNIKIILSIFILFSILVDLLLFNKFIHNNINIITILFCIALLPSIVLFMDGMSYGHDFGFHLARIEGIANGLKYNNFPVKMLGFFNDGYGYPTGVFYGDALLYIPAILRLIGFSVNSAYKLYIFIVNFLTTLITYYCCINIFKRQFTSIICTIAYVTASYRFVCIYVRSAVGEYTAMIFIPLLLLAIWNIYNNDIYSTSYKKNSILLSFSIASMLYTHILSVEMSLLVLLITAIIMWKKTIRSHTLIIYIHSLFITLLLGLGFIIPFLDYYLNIDIIIKNINPFFIQKYGAYLSDYFSVFSEYYGKSSMIVNERLQLNPGLILISALPIYIYFVIKGKSNKIINLTFLASVTCLFISSNLFPWDYLINNTFIGKIIAQVQFPWRFLSYAIIFLMVLFGLLIEKGLSINYWNKQIYLFVLFIEIISVCTFVSQYEDHTVQKNYIDSAELPQYTYSTSIPYSALGATEYLLTNTNIEEIDTSLNTKNAKAVVIEENGINMILDVQSNSNSSIEITRFYYPNYVITTENGTICNTALGDNNKIKILLSNPYKGCLYVRYIEPWYWRLSEIISLLSLVICIYYYRRPIKN
jgi:hypothetical protein